MRTKAALWLVLTFLAGAALGGSATLFTLQRVSPSASDSPRVSERQPPPPDRIAGRINRRANLSLSESQLERMVEILAASRDRVDSVTRESGRRIEAIREETRQEIRQILDPEQQLKFERYMEEWLERHRRRQAPDSGERPPTQQEGRRAPERAP